ncbi:uncharacterized protein B0T23DRAFT_9311 [Neurospora hispaniola]|uniref:Uncharacterized protein n=1 Tax=Neurospora hispaniola TaxID=588809 RepID=A0AAJ0MVC1_9PEZI|nr:hypothetical protein B0T23DRAFT_9311 [Neurospora hispaniola]
MGKRRSYFVLAAMSLSPRVELKEACATATSYQKKKKRGRKMQAAPPRHLACCQDCIVLGRHLSKHHYQHREIPIADYLNQARSKLEPRSLISTLTMTKPLMPGS